MKTNKANILVIGVSVALTFSVPVFAQTVSMRCHNPALNVAFDVNKSRASSHPVQFNIVRDATPGTIFVNGQNNGVCVATLDKDHVFTGSS